MSISIYNVDGKKKEKLKKPEIFDFPFHPVVIKKAFIHLNSLKFQPKGRDPEAGRKTTAESFGVGRGIARLPRIRGSPLSGRGAEVNMAVKGRKVHVTPPDKKIHKNLNKKEKKLALVSSIAATANKSLIESRGHILGSLNDFPLIINNDIEKITKTKEFIDIAEKIGFNLDMSRAKKHKNRGGKSSWRGRSRKNKIGPLVVYKNNYGIKQACKNIPGVDVVNIDDLSLLHLAPGGVPGRLTIWSNNAIESLDKLLSKNLKVKYING